MFRSIPNQNLNMIVDLVVMLVHAVVQKAVEEVAGLAAPVAVGEIPIAQVAAGLATLRRNCNTNKYYW